MRLEKPDSGDDKFHLVMTPVEWKEIYALAKFAQRGLAYDCKAAYVAQVFTYLMFVGQFGGFEQPRDFQSNQNMQAAFAAVDSLAETASVDGTNSGDAVLGLRKEEMRQLLIMLGKASEAEDQAEKIPYIFPDLEFPSGDYGDALYALLTALRQGKSLSISRWKIA